MRTITCPQTTWEDDPDNRRIRFVTQQADFSDKQRAAYGATWDYENRRPAARSCLGQLADADGWCGPYDHVDASVGSLLVVHWDASLMRAATSIARVVSVGD